MKKGCLILTLLFLLVSVVPACAGTTSITGKVDFTAQPPEGYKLLASNTPVSSLQFWHYSGGYWANNFAGIKLNDEDVSSAIYWDRIIPYNTTINIPKDLPDEVKNYLAKGGKLEDVKIKFTLLNSRPAKELFKNGEVTYELDSSKLTVSFKPIFRVSNTWFYNGDDANVWIPQIQDGFGVNVCSIFSKSGQHLGQSLGNEITPEDILNAEGYLKPGKTIRVVDDNGNVKSYASENVRIGQGTFANGGAVGLEFRFPIKADYYVPAEETPDFYPASPKTVYTGQSGSKVSVPVTVWNKGTYGETDLAWIKEGQPWSEGTWLDKEIKLGKYGKKDYTVDFVVSDKEQKYVFKANVDGKTPAEEKNQSNNTLIITVRPAGVDVACSISPTRPTYTVSSFPTTIPANWKIWRNDDGDFEVPVQYTVQVVNGPKETNSTAIKKLTGDVFFPKISKAGTYTLKIEAYPVGYTDTDLSNNVAWAKVTLTRKQAPPLNPGDGDIRGGLGSM